MKYNHILEVSAKEWFDKVNGNSYCEQNKIKLISHKQENCLKRELK